MSIAEFIKPDEEKIKLCNSEPGDLFIFNKEIHMVVRDVNTTVADGEVAVVNLNNAVIGIFKDNKEVSLLKVKEKLKVIPRWV